MNSQNAWSISISAVTYRKPLNRATPRGAAGGIPGGSEAYLCESVDRRWFWVNYRVVWAVRIFWGCQDAVRVLSGLLNFCVSEMPHEITVFWEKSMLCQDYLGLSGFFIRIWIEYFFIMESMIYKTSDLYKWASEIYIQELFGQKILTA